jgi:hypothetical protein
MVAAGVKIVLPGSFTDTTLPVMRDDSILTPGSLFLWDAAHSAEPSSGFLLPQDPVAGGAVIYNAAWKEAAAALGSGTASTLAGSLSLAALSAAGTTKGKVERSAKGGIHGIVSQSVALVAGDGLATTIPIVLRDYLWTNRAHSFYSSIWFNVTRPPQNIAGKFSQVLDNASGNYAYGPPSLRIAGPAADQQFSQSGLGARAPVTPSVNGPQIGTAAVANINALPSQALAESGNYGFNWGGRSPTASVVLPNGNGGGFASFIAYRYYLEDLTVSGRTYAAVDAIDFARFTAEVMTVGGRYYGDTTPTAPSAIP